MANGFRFRPLSNITEVTDVAATEMLAAVAPGPTPAPPADPLGPLAQLRGKWVGTGFNQIWRPLHDPANPQQRHFLELNLTEETLDFTEIDGPIPNRGLLQGDLFMRGLSYLQLVNDNHGNGLHLEPGVWLNIPATTDPMEPDTVARLGSIPHGTTVLAQGLTSGEAGPPTIQPVSITPFVIGNPTQLVPFPESDLSIPTPFRSPPNLIAGITQAMVDDPNSILTDAISTQKIVNTTNLFVTTTSEPVIGGGTANTAFLQGGANGPNADAVRMTSIFWIEEVEDDDTGEGTFLQLQYTQTVLLDFGGLSWPHVTVATLKLVPPAGG